MQNRIQAQWVCSRERRIALYKRSSINQSINHHVMALILCGGVFVSWSGFGLVRKRFISCHSVLFYAVACGLTVYCDHKSCPWTRVSLIDNAAQIVRDPCITNSSHVTDVSLSWCFASSVITSCSLLFWTCSRSLSYGQLLSRGITLFIRNL